MIDILAFILGAIGGFFAGTFFVSSSGLSKKQDEADGKIARDFLGRPKKAQIVKKVDKIDELLG